MSFYANLTFKVTSCSHSIIKAYVFPIYNQNRGGCYQKGKSHFSIQVILTNHLQKMERSIPHYGNFKIKTGTVNVKTTVLSWNFATNSAKRKRTFN